VSAMRVRTMLVEAAPASTADDSEHGDCYQQLDQGQSRCAGKGSVAQSMAYCAFGTTWASFRMRLPAFLSVPVFRVSLCFCE